MRLAGQGNVFSQENTPYQRSLTYTFSEFDNHPVVEYTITQGIVYTVDAPMLFAVHLEKSRGAFQFVYGSNFWEDDNIWTAENAEKFLELLNDFYVASDFGGFFESNIPYFQELSQRLYNELASQMNFDWFYQFGFGQEDLRISIRPSGSFGGFGPTLLNTVSYAILPFRDYYGGFNSLSFAAHEFAHSFANPIAELWYEENEEFRLFSQISVNHRRMPVWYNQSITVAREYVTRAYTILYLVENHNHDPLPLLLLDYNLGFTNIEYVYAMITEHEPMITFPIRIYAMITRNWMLIAILTGSVVFSVTAIICIKRMVMRRQKRHS
jgi:hypothetical protein